MPNNENHNLVALIKKYKEFSKDIESTPIGHHHFGDKMTIPITIL